MSAGCSEVLLRLDKDPTDLTFVQRGVDADTIEGELGSAVFTLETSDKIISAYSYDRGFSGPIGEGIYGSLPSGEAVMAFSIFEPFFTAAALLGRMKKIDETEGTMFVMYDLNYEVIGCYRSSIDPDEDEQVQDFVTRVDRNAYKLGGGACSATTFKQGGPPDYDQVVRELQTIPLGDSANDQFKHALNVSSPKQQAMWLCRAANSGHAKAQAVLAMRYRDGVGVVRSPVSAYKWLTLSMDAPPDMRHPDAGVVRKRLAAAMTDEQIEVAERQAKSWQAESCSTTFFK